MGKEILIGAKQFPNIHFGGVEEGPVDWRALEDDMVGDEVEDDAPCSKDVIEILGFDPDDLEPELKGRKPL